MTTMTTKTVYGETMCGVRRVRGVAVRYWFANRAGDRARVYTAARYNGGAAQIPPRDAEWCERLAEAFARGAAR